nr:hypothetical protein [Tanacetum cinerariifolium]
MNQQREKEALLAAQREQELREQKQAAQEKEKTPQNSDFQLYYMHNDVEDLIESALNSKLLSINLKSQRLNKEKQEVKNIVEQPTKRRTRITESLQNFKIIHKMSSISNTSQISLVNAIAPVLSIEEPKYSLSMENEHLSTILKMEMDEVKKSSVENLVPIPSEFEVTSDNESECDVPVCDDFTTFSNPLFDYDDDFSSSDDESFSVEDVPKENFKFYSNLLFDNEIISNKIDPHHFNAESDLIESLLNRDISTILILRLIIFSRNSPVNSLISIYDSQMEEIDLFLATDDLMPPGIEYDYYDSKGDIHFLEEFLSNDNLSLPENESSNFDHHNDPSFPRPPSEPPDVEVFFDFKPDTGLLTAKAVEDISEHYVLMPKVLPSQPTLCLNIDTLLPFSSENEDKVFKPGILSYLLVSHWDKITSDFSKNPMMMYGGDIPLLDVPFLHFYPP